jgi:hypothetical protein
VNWLNNVFNNITVTGNVEFNDGFLSNGDGTFTNQPGLFIYDGTPAAGNLIYTVTANNGSDVFGNNFLGGGSVSYDNFNLQALEVSGFQLTWFSMSGNPGSTFTQTGQVYSFAAGSVIAIIDSTLGSGFQLQELTTLGVATWSVTASNLAQYIGPQDGNKYALGHFYHETSTNVGVNGPAGTFTLLDTFNIVSGTRYELTVRAAYIGQQNAGAPVFSFAHGGSVSGGLSGASCRGYTIYGWVQNAVYLNTGLSDRTGPTLQNGAAQMYETKVQFTATATGSVGFSATVSVTGDLFNVNWTEIILRPIA